MGMYDYVKCQYPLPRPQAQAFVFQTKSMPLPYFDYYEVRADGTLWREENWGWEQVNYSGELEIHQRGEPPMNTWYSFQLWFHDGIVQDVIAHVSALD